MRANPAASTVRSLIATIPDQRLRELVMEILLSALRCLTTEAEAPEPVAPAPADKARRHWSRARRASHNASRREQRKLAAFAATGGSRRRERKPKATSDKASISNGAGAGNGQVSVKAFWKHAAKLEPKDPWRAVVRELGVSEGAAQSAHRDCALPPNISTAAAARFLTL